MTLAQTDHGQRGYDMKTHASETSIDCYHSHVVPFAEPTQLECVALEIDRQHVCTRRMVAKALGMETGTVSARVNKLIADGLVIETGASPCPITGKKVKWLKIAPAQKSMFDD